MNGIASALAAQMALRLRWGRDTRTNDGALIARPDQQRTEPAARAEALVTRYRETIFGYVARRVAGGYAEAEDVTADVFGAAFAALGRCPPLPEPADDPAAPDLAKAWLLGIARRKVADVCRKRARRRETPLDELVAATASAATFPPEHGPEALVLQGEAAEALRAVVDGLKPDQREALLLKYVEQMSLVEIGHVLNRSPAAVSSLLQRARAAALARGRHYFDIESVEEKP